MCHEFHGAFFFVLMYVQSGWRAKTFDLLLQ